MKLKYLFSIVVVLLTVLLMSGTALAAEIQINNWDDWNNISDNPNGDYILKADLVNGTNGSFRQITEVFTGKFNGNGYTISNVSGCFTAPFNQTDGAVISNVSLENISTNSYSNSGALVGHATDTIIDNCFVVNSDNDIISGGSYVGGLVGYLTESEPGKSKIINSRAETNVKAYGNDAGGLVGYVNSGTIINSHSYGSK